MEVPLEDFEQLARDLGCSLHRSAQQLSLVSPQPGCAMHFRVEESQARLISIDVHEDPQGVFFRDVVGLVLQLYSGNLEAELTWSPDGALEEHVHIHAGETSHPLLFEARPAPEDAEDSRLPVVDFSVPLIEQWLADADQAWEEYMRLKSIRERRSKCLT